MTTAIMDAPSTTQIDEFLNTPIVKLENATVNVLGQLYTSRAVFLKVQRGEFGLRKKLKSDQYEIRPDKIDAQGNALPEDEAEAAAKKAKGQTKADKQIMDCLEIDEINTIDNEITKFLNAYTLSTLFGKGIYCVSRVGSDRVNTSLLQLRAKRQAAITKLEAAYDQRVLAEQTRLGPLFDWKDYPPSDQVVAKYTFRWQFMEFTVPSGLPQTVTIQEQAKLDTLISDSASNCLQTMRQELKDKIDRLTSSLVQRRNKDGTPDTSGKVAIFRDTAFTDILDFTRTFIDRDFVDDKDLAFIVDQARNLLTPRTPSQANGPTQEQYEELFKSVRKDETTREYIKDQFIALSSLLFDMLSDAPQRMVQLD